MSKFNVSKLFLMETLVIGIFALASGLILGTLISQGFSVLTSSLFGADLVKYQFVFSIDAMLKTIVFFSIIFIVVIVLNTVVISKFTLMDLLYANKKSEKIRIKNIKVGFILFILSIVIIMVSYFGLVKFGIKDELKYIGIFTTTAVIGTFLFFFSIYSFFLSLIQNNKRVYFKDLNMFLLRQVGSRINTNFAMMGLICLMLTGSLTILSGGFGYKNAMDQELKRVTPYDVTLFNHVWNEHNPEKPQEIEKFLNSKDIKVEDFKEYVSLYYYDTKIDLRDLLKSYISQERYNKYANSGYNSAVYAISQTDYNKLAQLQGIKPISIKEGETIAFTNIGTMVDDIKPFINSSIGIYVNDKHYEIANNRMELLSIINTEICRDMLMIVLPDNDVKALDEKAELFVANYKDNDNKMNDKLTSILDGYSFQQSTWEDGGFGDDLPFDDIEDGSEENLEFENEITPYTRTYVHELSQGYTGSITFVVMYIGLILLMASAVILTLQQLSEASDNLSRYSILKRVGVGQESIHKVIFKQVFIYFMLPLVIAITHSIVAVSLITKAAFTATSMSIAIPALVSGSVLLIIYGAYFLLTYKTYKSIVK